MTYLDELKRRYDVRVYTPFKYFQGLVSKKQIESRFLEIVQRRSSSPANRQSYQPFSTDSVKPKHTRPSKYTTLFYQTYGDKHTSLQSKSKVTGVPLDILKRVFNKGKAAWRTGHRVGATETQWAYARVHSFLMLGCTVFSADLTLFEEALRRMTPKNRRQWLNLPIQCPQSTLRSPHYQKRLKTKNIIIIMK